MDGLPRLLVWDFLMLTLLTKFASWGLSFITGGSISRILDTIDKRVDNETERERIKTQAVESYVNAQAQVLTGRGWWFPLFFIIPLGAWFASVCVYSIFWCQRCAYPQSWSIAALPAPLDQWSGVIVSSLFIAKTGEALISRLKR